MYLLLWPEDGLLRKDDVRRVFDGSIFEQKAQEYSRKSRVCPIKSNLGGSKADAIIIGLYCVNGMKPLKREFEVSKKVSKTRPFRNI